MNQLNSIILEGNVVRDAVLLEPSEGFKVCKLCIAVNRFYKNKNDQASEEVSFFDVECFGKSAEYCQKKAIKGRGVRVVGRLKQDSWKDSSGKSQSRVFVVAEHIEYKPIKTESETESDASARDSSVAEEIRMAEAAAASSEELAETAVF